MKRQGDLLFIPISALPCKVETTSNYWGPKIIEDHIIQHGEATGHTHVLEGGTVLEYKGEKYIILDTEGQVVHQEHASIPLEPGYYLVRRQREYISPTEEREISD